MMETLACTYSDYVAHTYAFSSLTGYLELRRVEGFCWPARLSVV